MKLRACVAVIAGVVAELASSVEAWARGGAELRQEELAPAGSVELAHGVFAPLDAPQQNRGTR